MADLTITAAEVTYTVGAITKYTGVAGATITAGQACYIDTASSNVVKLAQSDGVALEATIKGLALHGASATQPITLAIAGNMDPGGTCVVGETYVLSRVAGAIAPIGDLATGDFVSHVGIGTTASNLKLSIVNSGVEVPA